MTRDEFEDHIHDICLGGNPVDGLSSEGQGYLDELYNELFNITLIRSSTMNNTTPRFFEATAIESFPAVEGEPQRDPIKHLWREARIGTDIESLTFQIKHELADGKMGVEIAAFSKRLEVKVEAVNFLG